MRRFLVALVAAFAVPTTAVADDADGPVAIQEWAVPYAQSRPRDPDVATTGEVWFVGQRGDYLAAFDPETGAFSRHALEDNTGPHNLIVGADGVVWYAGNLKGTIGRFDPASGETERIAMPDPAARDPHTLIFDADQSHIWFTVQGGNFVGRLGVAERAVELIPVPTERARPYGIVMTPDGTPWIALFGTNKLASVDPDTLALTEHPLPDPGARPRRIVATSAGVLYYTDYARGVLGRFDPATGATREWLMPAGGGARPYGMAIDGRDRVWFVETGVSPNVFVGFDPAGERFFSETAIPSGAGAVRHMVYDAPSGSIWFGTDANTLGRAQVMAE
jgi:virginiamycin B lyase